jgi:ankyrin repeat protein
VGARDAEHILRRWHEHVAAHPGATECQLADAQFFIAREHGLASWPKFVNHIERLAAENSPVARFEHAADAIITGDRATLERLLTDDPSLITARSTRDHHSTLLHYVSANGVEDFRQKTPRNIVEIARLLLDAGADVDATSKAYGGGSTTLGLTATSLHPEEAGVQIALLELLLARGARIEQPGLTGNGQGAISGCLANGQGDAARFFAARGAHLNLSDAAGVGRLDVVQSFFDASGTLRDPADRSLMESAFMNACGYGNSEVVGLLLDRGVDPGTRNKRRQTGLHWAMYGPHLEVVRVLLSRGAPVNAEDGHGDTPMNWAVNEWAGSDDSTSRDALVEAVRLLVGAGGRMTSAWFEMNDRRRRSLERARADAVLGPLVAGREH